MTKKNIAKDPLLRRYQAVLQQDRLTRSDQEAFMGVEIVPPAVRPKDVAPRAIRRAVREAMRKYVEKHGGTLART